MRRYDPQKHHRRSVRLKGYDYAQPGAYFVTICVHHRECVLGDVVDGRVRMSEYGRIAHNFWGQVPVHFPNVSIDTFVIMPNHVHVIIVIDEPCAGRGGVTPPLPGGITPSQPGGEGAETAPQPGGVTPSQPGGEGAGTAPQPGGVIPSQPGGEGAETPPLPGGITPSQPGGEGAGTAPLLMRPTLGQIVAYYKYQTTKQINRIRGDIGTSFWQRSFYERIVRTDRELDAVRQYINHNPMNWDLDRENPRR